MKSSLGKLKKIALNKSEHKENWDHRISVHGDGLAQAAKDMKDMRTCYDSLLSVAAATANSAYEFSESLLELGNCLLEKTAIYNYGESAGLLSMLGKAQLEIQKLVDRYRSHIMMTITNPSESLLSELRKVEEMKLQCDEKREMFEYMVGQVREKGKSRHAKGDTFTTPQLQAVCDEYDDAARLCIFRVESLKQGQSRSLLTQAARHHAAQLNFFREGCQYLESVEPHVKNASEMQHIDYEICDELAEEVNSFETRGNEDVSFDYRGNKQEMDGDACVSRNSMELGDLSSQPSKIKGAFDLMNTGKSQLPRRVGSHSAPIIAEKSGPAERIRELQTSVRRLNNTHVLPTPSDARTSIATTNFQQPNRSSKTLWHSSPLNADKPKNELGVGKSQILEVEENNKSSKKISLPLPLPTLHFDTADTQKTTTSQAFSLPLASRSPYSSKPLLPASLNNGGSSTLLSSPKISELHELPKPPDALSSNPLVVLGHSAPLGDRNRREVASPPLTSISLSSIKAPNTVQMRGKVNSMVVPVSSSA